MDIDIFLLVIISVVAVTSMMILYTRELAKRIQERAERRKSLEKEREKLLEKVEELEMLLAEKEGVITRQSEEIEKLRAREKEEAKFRTELMQRLNELHRELESVFEGEEKQ